MKNLSNEFSLFAKTVADNNLKNTLEETIVDGIKNICISALQSQSESAIVVESLINVIRATKTISSTLLEKRVLYFLYSIKDIDIEKRHKFINKKIRNHEETFAEVTFVALEKIDRLNKAMILANIFVARANECIDDDTYLRLLHALIYVYYDDLYYLKELYEKREVIENYRLLSLSSYGLLNSRSPNKYGSERKTFYRLSELGFVLIKYGLDVENCEKYVWRNEEDETKIQKPTISD